MNEAIRIVSLESAGQQEINWRPACDGEDFLAQALAAAAGRASTGSVDWRTKRCAAAAARAGGWTRRMRRAEDTAVRESGNVAGDGTACESRFRRLYSWQGALRNLELRWQRGQKLVTTGRR